MRKNRKIEIKKTGKALHSYMKFRAAHEGVEYDLSPDWFANLIDAGCETFFGVIIQNGQLIDDEQQPKLFMEWKLSSPRGWCDHFVRLGE